MAEVLLALDQRGGCSVRGHRHQAAQRRGGAIPAEVALRPGCVLPGRRGSHFRANRSHSRCLDAITRIHHAMAAGLRPSVPMFTKPVARGLGAAEDPPAPFSFGGHRCKLAARALWRSFRGEHDRAAQQATLAAVYAEEGLDPRYPYLAAGSIDEFDLEIKPAASVSRVERRATVSPREAAIRIGQSLCRTAIWDVTGVNCNWIGRVCAGDSEALGRPQAAVGALGPGLHEGSLGIALYLSQLHAATGDEEFRRTAQAALARSKRMLDGSAPRRTARSLHSSQAPVAMLSSTYPQQCATWIFAKIAWLRRESIAAVLEAVDANINVPRFDATVRDGLAGLGEVVLSAGIMLEDASFLERARSLAQTLIDRHSEEDDWPMAFSCGGPNPSLLLGTAGIGYWLLRLAEPERVPCWLLFDSAEQDEVACKLCASSS